MFRALTQVCKTDVVQAFTASFRSHPRHPTDDVKESKTADQITLPSRLLKRTMRLAFLFALLVLAQVHAQTCSTSFSSVVIAGTTFYVSNQEANYTTASQQCRVCLNSNLASTTNAVAIAGSPGKLQVSLWFSTFSDLVFSSLLATTKEQDLGKATLWSSSLARLLRMPTLSLL